MNSKTFEIKLRIGECGKRLDEQIQWRSLTKIIGGLDLV